MEKFLARNIVAGNSQILGIKKVHLNLPNAKHYEVHAAKNGEDVLHMETLLEGACRRKTSEVHHTCHEPGPADWKWPSDQNSPAYLVQKPIPSLKGPCVTA